MNNNASDSPAASHKRRAYSEEEYENALDFAMFLYDLWRKRNLNEIMKVDKTIYDNHEEPTNS